MLHKQTEQDFFIFNYMRAIRNLKIEKHDRKAANCYFKIHLFNVNSNIWLQCINNIIQGNVICCCIDCVPPPPPLQAAGCFKVRMLVQFSRLSDFLISLLCSHWKWHWSVFQNTFTLLISTLCVRYIGELSSLLGSLLTSPLGPTYLTFVHAGSCDTGRLHLQKNGKTDHSPKNTVLTLKDS